MINDIFQIRGINYNLRSQTDFTNCVNTNIFGINSLRYFASKVWNIVPLETKNSESVKILTTKIRNWEPIDFYDGCYVYRCHVL